MFIARTVIHVYTLMHCDLPNLLSIFCLFPWHSLKKKVPSGTSQWVQRFSPLKPPNRNVSIPSICTGRCLFGGLEVWQLGFPGCIARDVGHLKWPTRKTRRSQGAWESFCRGFWPTTTGRNKVTTQFKWKKHPTQKPRSYQNRQNDEPRQGTAYLKGRLPADASSRAYLHGCWTIYHHGEWMIDQFPGAFVRLKKNKKVMMIVKIRKGFAQRLRWVSGCWHLVHDGNIRKINWERNRFQHTISRKSSFASKKVA